MGHHRRAGIRRGADVRQLQDAFAEHALLLHRRQGTEAVDDAAGGIHRVDALFRVGAVAGHAVGLQTDLRAAALGALDIHFRRLADDHQIRLHGGADLTGGHALEALLVHCAGHPDLAGKIAVCQTGKALCGEQVRRHGALHIRGAAPVKAAVLQFGGKGIMTPVSGIIGADGIYMAVKQNAPAGTLTPDAAQHIAVFIGVGHVKMLGTHKGDHQIRHGLFLAGIAACGKQVLTKGDQLALLQPVHHVSFLLITCPALAPVI